MKVKGIESGLKEIKDFLRNENKISLLNITGEFLVGKTSIIKAIAKDTNRHIFNIKLHSDTTKTQLHNLFFNEIIGLFFECEVVISKKEIFSGIALMTDSFIANFPAKCS